MKQRKEFKKRMDGIDTVWQYADSIKSHMIYRYTTWGAENVVLYKNNEHRIYVFYSLESEKYSVLVTKNRQLDFNEVDKLELGKVILNREGISSKEETFNVLKDVEKILCYDGIASNEKIRWAVEDPRSYIEEYGNLWIPPSLNPAKGFPVQRLEEHTTSIKDEKFPELCRSTILIYQQESNEYYLFSIEPVPAWGIRGEGKVSRSISMREKYSYKNISIQEAREFANTEKAHQQIDSNERYWPTFQEFLQKMEKEKEMGRIKTIWEYADSIKSQLIDQFETNLIKDFDNNIPYKRIGSYLFYSVESGKFAILVNEIDLNQKNRSEIGKIEFHQEGLSKIEVQETCWEVAEEYSGGWLQSHYNCVLCKMDVLNRADRIVEQQSEYWAPGFRLDAPIVEAKTIPIGNNEYPELCKNEVLIYDRFRERFYIHSVNHEMGDDKGHRFNEVTIDDYNCLAYPDHEIRYISTEEAREFVTSEKARNRVNELAGLDMEIEDEVDMDMEISM